MAAYRLAAEAMNNAMRHAQASTITVEIALNGRLCVAVVDDGVGMDPASTAGVGLASMRERAEELGGTFTISSRPGQTMVRATFSVAATVTHGN